MRLGIMLWVGSVAFGVALLISRASAAESILEHAEDFSADPISRGWRIFGATNLFAWNPEAANLEVTWDSREPNSYFYRSLGTVLTRNDSFALQLELRLSEVRIGVQEGQPFTFQVAFGFIHLASATSPEFVRGTGRNSPNLVEFNYFADSGFGATVSPIIVSTNIQFIPSFTFPLEMTVGDLFSIEMQYDGPQATLRTRMTRNREPFGPIRDVKLPAHFTDFRVDAIALSSYSSRGSDGSLWARGVVDNLKITLPPPPISNVAGRLIDQRWRVSFQGRTGWNYFLERTTDFRSWTTAAQAVASSDSMQTLETLITHDHAFFRIRADRP